MVLTNCFLSHTMYFRILDNLFLEQKVV